MNINQFRFLSDSNNIKYKKLDFSNVICFHPLKGETWCAEVATRLRKEGYKVASFRPAKWADYELNDMSPLERYRLRLCEADMKQLVGLPQQSN